MNKTLRRWAAAGAIAAFLPAGIARAQDTEKMTMRQAVTLALQNSRDLALARVQYTVALNEAGLDRAAFLPNLYTGSGAAYTSGFPSISGSPPAVFQMSYNQAIFNPLLKGQQRAAEDRAKNMKLELDRMHDDVIVRAATAYLELAEVRHSLELMRKEQASVEKILGVTRDRVAANQELSIEVTRGELDQARVQERIIKLEGRDETLTQQIRNLTGISDGQSIEVDTEEPSFESNLPANDMINAAIQSDRGIQEAENERLARQHLLRGAHLSYWPTVEVVGQYAILSKFNNYLDFYKKFERNNVSLGVQVTIPIFASKTRATVALAKTELQAAELTLGNKRKEVRLDVQQKLRTVREVDAAREVARLDLKLAQETLQIAQSKFDEGRLTLRDIERARLDESDKWVAFLDADFARQQGQLSLLQATGQLAKVFQ
ncbi:MAG TPA: TolC family protein [Candidatus Acidoferrales bacterium]|nr:TolC family protein [Candidatus Acidoferrales bacterium]